MQHRPSLLFCLKALFQRYTNHHVGRDSAALAYYLLFALFPLLVFLCLLPAVLQVNVAQLLQSLQIVVPLEIIQLFQSYVDYVAKQPTTSLLSFCVIFSIYFPWRAARALMGSVRKAYNLPPPQNLLLYQGLVAFYTVCLLVAMVLSLALIASGKQVLSLFNLPFSGQVIQLWAIFRFVILAGVAFGALTILYWIALGRRIPQRSIFSGVLLAMMAWVIFSALFSWYVSNMGRYSVLYGSIGTVIVLLLWLYTTAEILILGAEWNSILQEFRHG